MPNHITNRIELVGDSKRVAELVEKFSTHFEETENRTHDGCIIYCSQDGEYGWLNEKTGLFNRRDVADDVDFIPEGFSPDLEPAWTRFPDFNKIVPMPKELEEYSPHLAIVTAVEAKYQTPVSGNILLASMQFASREKASYDFNEADQKLFERGCRNYEEVGYIYWYDWTSDMWGTKWNAYDCEKKSDNVFLFDTAWSGVPKLIKKMAKEFPDIEIFYEYSDEDTGNNCGVYKFTGEQAIGGKLENRSNEAYELAFKLRPGRKDDYELTAEGYQYKEEEEEENEARV